MARSPVFADVELVPFFDRQGVPVFCNAMWATAGEARAAARGDVVLAYCPESGLISNTAFDPALVRYEPSYDASLHFSSRFAAWARSLAEGLVAKHGIRGKDVIDIGCGKGDFLRLLCEAGDNRGVGFDSSFDGDTAGEPFEVSREPFGDGAYEADLIVCRHVLEHVHDLGAFLGNVRRVAARRPHTVLYLEVPNALWTLRDLGVWDVLYEHVHYFTEASLTRLLASHGFAVESAWTDYGGQFLCVEARAGDVAAPPEADGAVAEIRELAARFARAFAATRDGWNAELDGLLDAGERVALWGAGSKGVMFLNTLDRGPELSPVIDVNPRKHGRHVAGTGQPVAPAEVLCERPVDLILVMNPLYLQEIGADVARLGLDVELRSV